MEAAERVERDSSPLNPAPAPEAPETFRPWPATPQVLRATAPWFGDLPAIRERGALRVLVSYSRTNFFLAKGELRGFEYEMFRELEKHLDGQREEHAPPLEFAFVPVPFDDLLPALREGRGDVAAAALTITPERAREVSFTDPYLSGVDEVLVAHVGSPAVESWDDLAGRSVYVARGTSFAEHLAEVSGELVQRGLEPIDIRADARGLTTEDMLELVSCGALDYTVADRYLVELWSELLDGLRIEDGLTTARGGQLAWAVRPDAPELEAMLNDWVRENRKGTLIGNVLFKRYFGRTQWIENPRLAVEAGRINPFLVPLKRIAEEHGFDWRVIAAQAYQESGFDPDAVSRSGAIGLMQLLPSTAKDMGVTDLRDPEQNLLAGVRYMDWLRRNYFGDPELPPEIATDLALAAYNAGPGRVKRWRAAAPARGLDPDRWFGNVEQLALEDVGMQPVRYVGNINKYALVFTLVLDDLEAKAGALEHLRGDDPH